ncbi:MAG: aminotransferase class V-fold PLP-dependent enzyme [Pseudomonadota bacterium]
MFTRREGLIGAGAVTLLSSALSIAKSAAQSASHTPDDLARDESYWSEIARAYSLDGRYIILNGGGNNPHPTTVTDALNAFDRQASSAPRPHNYTLLNHKELIRTRLAGHFGCAPDELALTRNTTEGLNVVLWGLDLQPGDEILTSQYDDRYAGAILEQRAARHGIVLKTVELPVSPSADEVVSLFQAMISDRTKLIVASHLTDGWGFVLPVKGLSELAHQNGARMLADGALTFGHIPINVRELGCDYYATSLRKHLTAPLGTGALYVREELIDELWPLYGVRAESTDIRKFEQIGTRSGPTIAAISQALDFYETVGPENKAARMRYLTEIVSTELDAVSGVRFISERDPALRTGLARIAINDISGRDLTRKLREDYRIYTYGNWPGRDDGVYISPNLFNTPQQMRSFVGAIRQLAA